MKLILQRVKSAELYINEEYNSSIKKGLVVYVGISNEDSTKDIEYCIEKLINLRIFNDSDNKLNLSVQDVKGELMIISNFTIYGDTKKGRRPSYIKSASAEKANKVYEQFLEKISKTNIPYKSGRFQSHMNIIANSDGPVNIIIETN